MSDGIPHHLEKNMRTNFAILTLTATLIAANATTAMAQFNDPMPESEHWRVRATVPAGEPTANQLARYGYKISGPVDRVVNIDGTTKYLNVTQLEAVQINANGKGVTWMFDTLGTAPFSLPQVIPGTDGVTVYVAENPTYQAR